jgi:hypothetical protein
MTLDKCGFWAKIICPHFHLRLHGKRPIFSKNKVQNPYKNLKIHAKLRLIMLIIFPVIMVVNWWHFSFDTVEHAADVATWIGSYLQLREA